MIFLYFQELLIDETKHEVDLAIKQSLELFASCLSEPRMQRNHINQDYLLREYHI